MTIIHSLLKMDMTRKQTLVKALSKTYEVKGYRHFAQTKLYGKQPRIVASISVPAVMIGRKVKLELVS